MVRLIVWLLLACAVVSVPPALAGKVTVASATNFVATADRIKREFEQGTGHTVILVAGSTGKLTSQVTLGAPFDVFLAADQVRPQRLIDDGYGVAGSRFTYAAGKLVLWGFDPERFADAARGAGDILLAGDFRRLAIANPQLAPYGTAALEVLETLRLSDKIKDKLIYGENVGQAYAYAASGNAELAMVALPFVLTARTSNRGAYRQIPEKLHKPILQDAVLLTRGANNEAAREFLAFLKGDEASTIMRSLGFEPVQGKSP